MAARSGLAAVGVLLGLAAGVLAEEKPPTTQPDFRREFSVDKADFSDRGVGRYFVLMPGFRLILADGKDTLIITVLDETKVVDGVTTRVVEERETEGGKLKEVSRNYFAIDRKTQDAYYFGEDVDIYKGGKIVNHEGAWLSGVDGAKFGLAMPGRPQVGAMYYQELAPDVAMDRAEVVSVSGKVTVPAGQFANCLVTRESSAIERGTEEKPYAPGVGLLKDGGFKLSKIQLPAAIEKAFRSQFAKAKVRKIEVEVENGVAVYDFEFRNGAAEQECDIAEDGTVLEVTLVVAPKDVPEAAMKAITAHAPEGARLGRIERITIGYELKDGKPLKLTEPATRYAAEYSKDGKEGEVEVTPDGAEVKE
ncbi:MAG: hypothetical protein BIFFINMI_01528 [Phycisphaerae bacterium]|nr:hypothetical protein [Phycisphaerae bacterium]